MNPAKLWQVKNPVFAGLQLSQLTKQRCGGVSGKIRVICSNKSELPGTILPKAKRGHEGSGAVSQPLCKKLHCTWLKYQSLWSRVPGKARNGLVESPFWSNYHLQPKCASCPELTHAGVWILTHTLLKEQEEERKGEGNQPYLCSNNLPWEQMSKPWLCLKKVDFLLTV